MNTIRSLLAIIVLGFGTSSFAEEVDESAMFGDSKPAGESHAKEKPPVKDAFQSGEVTDNALSLGGAFYQRIIASPQQNGSASSVPIAFPLQFDAFLDGRPNDRVRGFVLGRMFYDASKDAFSRSTSGSNTGSLSTSSTSAAPTSLTTSSIPNNPAVTLNQAWLKFDIDRSVFVTVGRQHIKWGTGRFWNPTDFLHPQRRDPLLPYDLRVGATMAKFELPVDSIKTNFYAVTLLDNPVAASTLGQLGQAFRVEKVIGSTEIGVEAIFRGASTPVYGGDLSFPLGPFDLQTEVAFLNSSPSSGYALSAPLTAGSDLSTVVTSNGPNSNLVQVTSGLSYSFAWRDNRLATLGIEYFYNQPGYDNFNIYPVLIFIGQYQPFYTGKNYASVFLTFEGPDAEKRTSYTFSTIGNLSDRSYISRLDFSWRVLTYLTFEAYGDVHYGTTGGEFNFSMNTPTLTYAGTPIAALSLPPTIFDVGLGLRVAF